MRGSTHTKSLTTGAKGVKRIADHVGLSREVALERQCPRRAVAVSKIGDNERPLERHIPRACLQYIPFWRQNIPAANRHNGRILPVCLQNQIAFCQGVVDQPVEILAALLIVFS